MSVGMSVGAAPLADGKRTQGQPRLAGDRSLGFATSDGPALYLEQLGDLRLSASFLALAPVRCGGNFHSLPIGRGTREFTPLYVKLHFCSSSRVGPNVKPTNGLGQAPLCGGNKNVS